MPGNSSPDRYAIMAPPPVQMCEKLEIKPSLLKNSTVSPPPTTEYALLSIIALAISNVPFL